MNEEPLRLIPPEWRAKAIDELGLSNDKYKVRVDGDLDPASRFIFKAPDAQVRAATGRRWCRPHPRAAPGL